MNTICHGEIYLVTFSPSIGHEYQKVRPAVIISTNELLKKSPLFICIAITGKENNQNSDDFIIKKDGENNLRVDSVIKMHHVYTFDKKRIHKYIGKTNNTILQQIKTKLRCQFGL